MAGALTAAIAAAFSGGAAVVTDPYFEYTTLLLPGNGTNGAQNNTFLDGSTNNFTITRNGNTTQGTFSPFSQTGWGNYFDGTGDSLSIANNVALQLTGAFTMEAWYYPLGFPGSGLYDCLLTTGDNSLSNAIAIYINSSGGIQLYNHVTNAAIFNTASGVVLNAWNHIAATRNSSNGVDLWLNGVSQGSTVTVSSSFTSTTPTRIGTSSTNQDCYGYISNARIVKGVAVYTGAFTPPTSPLAATQSAGTNISAITGTQTSLLTCQSNRFIDNSTNNFTITVNGNTSVVAFSPFNPTASWSAATYGGSGYFDGNGDYLSVADNAAFTMGTGDFTVEYWVYWNGTSSTFRAYGQVDSGGSLASISIRGGTDASNKVINGAFSGTTDYLCTSTASLVANTWNHIAFVRDGTTLRQYINGGQDGTASISTASVNDSSNQFAIGRAGEFNGNYFGGYISSFRLLKGTCLYPSGTAFTPPTAPLTAITNTSLLLNFTNAGIYDATSKNDLETLDNTVNGVRISTTQSKFGGSSIYFDGTGTDYLWIQADQPIQRFGTAPFTIEMWIRLAALGSARGLVAKGTSTTGWLVSLNTSNQVVFTYGTSTITSTGTISQDVWTYIAVVREGTSTNQTKIYIGGVNDGTGTVSTDFTQTSSMYIGANRTGGDLYSGYIQDVRITNGYARTVTTVPTTAFPTL
jgi:Concanavalin A-like lectin/glucanases superfamily